MKEFRPYYGQLVRVKFNAHGWITGRVRHLSPKLAIEGATGTRYISGKGGYSIIVPAYSSDDK